MKQDIIDSYYYFFNRIYSTNLIKSIYNVDYETNNIILFLITVL
jgi:hypothetical protein